ncbi:MAG: hypothetical protein ACRYF0_02665 [Janthinobacterium lividum]
MEARAPYGEPQGPRNLAAPLATWLRQQGFVATEQLLDTLATVRAHWVAVGGERFELTYTWAAGPVPDATCTLRVLYPNSVWAETLFTAQRVRRLKEARLLVSNCVRLANARLLARPAATPATS